jgi:hypothetical protein
MKRIGYDKLGQTNIIKYGEEHNSEILEILQGKKENFSVYSYSKTCVITYDLLDLFVPPIAYDELERFPFIYIEICIRGFGL